MTAPPEVGPTEPANASPLWPLVLLLAEIATRVEREQALGRAGATPAFGPIDDAVHEGRRPRGTHFRPRDAAAG